MSGNLNQTTTFPMPERGQKWIESCGWWRRVIGFEQDDHWRVFVLYEGSRGGPVFQRRCSLSAWAAWAKANHVRITT